MSFDKNYTHLLETYQVDYPLKKLSYKYSALEPYVSKETMEVHYKLYKNYTKKLNQLLEKRKKPDIKKLIRNISKYSNEVYGQAGGYYNHMLYWQMLVPKSVFGGDIKYIIEQQYGSLDRFTEDFCKTACEFVGSSWTWCVIDPNDKLGFILTENQQNPYMNTTKNHILFGIDMWEHQWLNDHGDKQKWVNAFFKVLNWDYCNQVLSHV